MRENIKLKYVLNIICNNRGITVFPSGYIYTNFLKKGVSGMWDQISLSRTLLILPEHIHSRTD